MFENSPVIELAVGRSSTRQRILALLMDGAGCRLHLREIQRRASTSPGTASRELGKLVAAGLIEREAEGNQVYFRASNSPVATMLRSLLIAMPAPEAGSRPPRRLPRSRPARSVASLVEASHSPEAPVKAGVGAAAVPVGTPIADAAPADSQAATLATNTAAMAAESLPQPEPIDADAAPRLILPRPKDGVATTSPQESSAAVSTTSEPVPAAIAPAPDAVGVEVAGRLAETVRTAYGDALRGIYLCGARAAGPAPNDADVETIIVLDRVDHYGAELERTSHAVAALSRDFHVVVSRIFVTEAAWNGGADGVPPAIRSEAVAV